MIDLHCHILPAIDDGAADLETALEMARMAVADGITHLCCTPHIIPGLYENDRASVAKATARLRRVLDEHQIDLKLLEGGDVHVAPDLLNQFNSGMLPVLGRSNYFLLEPPHHVLPPRLVEIVRALVEASCVPIITHPERLTWIEAHYDVLVRLSSLGALVQLTAGSITGAFGSRPKALAERMLDEGLVDVIATDAHNLRSRPPILSRARDEVAKRLGEDQARDMVLGRPAAILARQPLPERRTAIMPQNEVNSESLVGRLGHWLDRLRGS